MSKKKYHGMESAYASDSYAQFIYGIENSLEVSGEDLEISITRSAETAVTRAVRRMASITPQVEKLKSFARSHFQGERLEGSLWRIEENRQAYFCKQLNVIAGALTYGVVRKSAVKSANKIALEMLNDTHGVKFQDMQGYAYELVMEYWARTEKPEDFTLEKMESRRVRKGTSYSPGHVFTEADYKTVADTRIRWLFKALSAYMEAQRGVRIPVTETVIKWTEKHIENAVLYIPKVRRKYTSAYLPIFDIDGVSDEALFRVAPSPAYIGDHGEVENPMVAMFKGRILAEKVIRRRAYDILMMRLEGVPVADVCKAYGYNSTKTVRDSVDASLRAIAKWLDLPIRSEVEGEKGHQHKVYYINGNRLPL